MDNRSELKAGIVILVALAMLATLIIAVGKFETIWIETALVTVRFKNIYGLKKDDPVRYAGVQIGRVKEIKVVGTKDESRAPEVAVALEIEASYPVRTGSTAAIDKSITGATSVEINPGTGELMDLRKRPVIPEEEVMSFTQIQKRLGLMVERVDKELLGPDQIKQVKEIIRNIKDASNDLVEAVRSAKDMLAENRENVKASLANAKDVAVSIKGIVDKNRANVDQTLDKVKVAATQLADFSEKLNTTLFTQANKVVGGLSTIVDENRDTVRQIMVNVRDVATNFKLMSDDLRSHPWKLLNPTEKDVRSDNLATAAKEVTIAARFIDDTASRLATVAQKPHPSTTGVAEQIKQLVDDLKAAVTHLQESQQQLNKAVGGK